MRGASAVDAGNTTYYSNAVKRKTASRARPLSVVTFRLPRKAVRELDGTAHMFGYPDKSAFLREFVLVCISADTEKAGAFLQKIFKRAAEKAQASLPGFEDVAKGLKG